MAMSTPKPKTAQPSIIELPELSEEPHTPSSPRDYFPFPGHSFNPFTKPPTPLASMSSPNEYGGTSLAGAFAVFVEDLWTHNTNQTTQVKELKTRIQELEEQLAAAQEAASVAEQETRQKASEARQLREKATYLQKMNGHLSEVNAQLMHTAHWYYCDFVTCFNSLQLLQKLVEMKL